MSTDYKNVKDTIKKVVKKNPNTWINTRDMKLLFDFNRKSIYSAIHKLEEEGILEIQKKDVNWCSRKVNHFRYDGNIEEN